jgi:hypothetical protein
MATNEVLMTPDNLKSNQFDAAFGNTPHKVYAVYDDLMDEFIVKLTKPETLVAEFPISETFSLLVEPNTLEVVGVQFSEFMKAHLPSLRELNKIWYKRNLAGYFSTYRELDYKPKEPTQPIRRVSYYFYGVEKIDRILATA